MRIHSIVDREPQLASLALTAAFACALVTAPAVSSAQVASQLSSQMDARWQPWIGCWQPAAPEASVLSSSTTRNNAVPLVCVIPATTTAASSGVNVVTITDGKIVARDTIDASGQRVARSKDGCNGVENANWSADGHRLYVSSDFTCPGGLKRTSSGLFAISPTGEWVNVQAVNAAGSKGVRTQHYTDAGTSRALPREISEALRGRDLAISTARAAAGTRLSNANIVEASRNLDSTVVAAWIIDRGQGFAVDARQLVALADGGVPSDVTDAMVAVSYPKAFVLNRPSDFADGGVSGPSQDVSGVDIERASQRNVRVMMMPEYSPFGYSPFDYYGYGTSPYGYSPYGYSPYGYSRYGYSAYGGYYSPYAGYGSGYGGLYPPPIIVLKGTEPSPPRGYVVKGHGYTQTTPRSGGSTAEPRPTVSSPPAGSNGNSAPPPPPPPASSGRTAHERP